MFVNRARELAFLTSLLTRDRPGPGQLVLLYGRRRIGKTALLRHWATQANVSATYWVAERELVPFQRRRIWNGSTLSAAWSRISSMSSSHPAVCFYRNQP